MANDDDGLNYVRNTVSRFALHQMTDLGLITQELKPGATYPTTTFDIEEFRRLTGLAPLVARGIDTRVQRGVALPIDLACLALERLGIHFTIDIIPTLTPEDLTNDG